MLIYGNKELLYTVERELGGVHVINFSSLSQEYQTVDILPKTRFDIDDSQMFDASYAEYIMSDDYRFTQFFNIIYSLYLGNIVYVLVSKDEFYDILNESLFKFIQQRYGYISNEINSDEDIKDLTEGSFSISGLYNLDFDKDRFVSIYEKYNK